MSGGKDGFVKLRHDLRTCVNQILGYSELLREEAEEVQPDFVPDLDHIGTAGRRLLKLLDGLFSDEASAEPGTAETEETPATAARPQVGASEDQPGSILVVDDDELNRDLLSKWLGKRGHRITCAGGGREALRLIESEPFDLVLLDVMMPEISGLQVLMQIRTRFAPEQLPVIMATARSESESIVAALSLGANDHLTKPLDLHVVLARVRSQLSLKRAVEKNESLATQIELRNRFIRQMFGRYLSDDVVSNLLETHQGLAFGGERRTITILMSDLRGFSSLTERLSPEQVVAVINNYLEVMTEIIVDSGGTIDEFIGDAILVLFGAPVPRDDHSEAAARCAIRMQNAMAEVNRRNEKHGLPEVRMGIGIHTGEVVVGNIGSEKRAKYGVVGSAVNLASRVESYTFGGQILLSPATWDAIRAGARERGTMHVSPKGFEEGITLHDLVALDGENPLSLIGADADAVVNLASPIAVEYSVLVGKETGGATRSGSLTRVSMSRAELRCGENLDSWSNLKLSLTDGQDPVGEAYAKVTDEDLDAPECFMIRFTSMDPAVEQFLESLTTLS